MTDTLTVPVRATYGKQAETVTPRVLTANFGDGYRQEAGDGLNVLSRKIDPTWDVLSSAQADDLLAFFEDKKGYIAFYWTPDGETVSRQWKCTSWTRSPVEYPNVSVTAHFELVFDL